ncbi:hypothetical protein LXA43DRAFT_1129444 [Ganoderma leucocontextum]|nr:hypothetical protein LXA43DRAFT_1129444 [Ganoderma leucocontextum]
MCRSPLLSLCCHRCPLPRPVSSDESPNVPRARKYGFPRHLKNVKSAPQHALFDLRTAPTELAIQLAERKVREQNVGRLDNMQFGHEIAFSLGPGLGRVPGWVLFSDDAPRTVLELPVVCMNNTNVFGVDAMLTPPSPRRVSASAPSSRPQHDKSLVPAEKLKPGDPVGINKDSYLVGG